MWKEPTALEKRNGTENRIKESYYHCQPIELMGQRERHNVNNGAPLLNNRPPRQADYLIPILPKKETSETSSAVDYIDIEIIHQLQSEDEIVQMLELDKQVYNPAHLVDYDIEKKWFNKNPNLYTVAKDVRSQKIMGYVGIFPLAKEVFDKTLLPTFDESDIQPSDIYSYELHGIYHVYL